MHVLVDACVVGTDILQTAHTNTLCHHPNIIIIINNLIIIIITRSGMRTQSHLAEKHPDSLRVFGDQRDGIPVF